MTEHTPEDLLGQLAALADREGDEPEELDLELLLAYRAGRLSGSEAERLEERLARSATARRRLAELAGLPSAPRPEVRRAVLAAFERTRPGRARILGSWWAAAAAVVAVVGLFLVLRQPEAPALPDYELTAKALTAVRGQERSTLVLRAQPETTLRLTVSPLGPPVSGSEMGLYREDGDRLIRLGPEEGLTLELERGTGFLRGRAGELAAGRRGTLHLFVVVARRGELPDSVAVPSGARPASALALRGRRVLPLELEVVNSGSSEVEP